MPLFAVFYESSTLKVHAARTIVGVGTIPGATAVVTTAAIIPTKHRWNVYVHTYGLFVGTFRSGQHCEYMFFFFQKINVTLDTCAPERKQTRKSDREKAAGHRGNSDRVARAQRIDFAGGTSWPVSVKNGCEK